MRAELGYYALHTDRQDYALSPTFGNMRELGSPAELLEIYNDIHAHTPSGVAGVFCHASRVNLARRIIMACADCESIANLLVRYKLCGGMPMPSMQPLNIGEHAQVAVAAGLARHGLAGVNRKLNRSKSDSEVKEIDLNGYIAMAVQEFGLSKTEAENITMTELTHHIAICQAKNGDSYIDTAEVVEEQDQIKAWLESRGMNG